MNEVGDFPMDVWKTAAEVVLKCCNVSSAYVAVVTQAEEPSYVWPEEEEGNAGNETDDDAEGQQPAVSPDAEAEAEVNLSECCS